MQHERSTCPLECCQGIAFHQVDEGQNAEEKRDQGENHAIEPSIVFDAPFLQPQSIGDLLRPCHLLKDRAQPDGDQRVEIVQGLIHPDNYDLHYIVFSISGRERCKGDD